MTMRKPRTLHRRTCTVCHVQRHARHFTRRKKTCDGCLPPLERPMTAAEVRAEEHDARGRADRFIDRIRAELDPANEEHPIEDTMAKKQTRRSISVKGITYQRLQNYCESQGRSISGFLEDIIAARLDAEKVPVPKAIAAPPEPEPVYREDITPQHFTF